MKNSKSMKYINHSDMLFVISFSNTSICMTNIIKSLDSAWTVLARVENR